MARKNQKTAVSPSLVTVLAVFWAVAVLPPPASGQTPLVIPAETVLSPEAKRDFETGLAAAQAQHWDSALKHFQAAQHRVLAFPPLLLNLGLAEEAAGNQLAAVYWLRAFLIAAPDAPNGEDVRLEIKKLLGQLENNVRTILDAARSIAAQFPDGEDKTWAIAHADEQYAFFYATTRRDIGAALRVLPNRSSDLWVAYGQHRAHVGDLDEAIAAIPQVEGQENREKLVSAIADSVEASGTEAQLDGVLERFKDDGAALEWRARQAIRRNDPAEAERLIGMLKTTGADMSKPDEVVAQTRNYFRSESLHTALVTYYLGDFRNRDRQRLAYANAKWIAVWSDSYEVAALAMSYLDVGSGSVAREIAENADVEHGLSVPEAFLSIILGNQDKLETDSGHSSSYLAAYIRFYVATGRPDEARRVVAEAPSELRPNIREIWNANQVGISQLNYALWFRMIDLLSLDDIQPAKSLLREFPRPRCDVAHNSPNLERRPLALSHIAEWEIDHHDLTAAAEIIGSMPESNPSGLLMAQCVVHKAEKIEQLAEAYLKAGRRSAASDLIPKVAKLIWQGALSGPIVERLANLQEALSDSEGAAATRRLAKYSPLSIFVNDAYYHAHSANSADVSRQVATITSRTKSRGAGEREAAREMVTRLLDLADHLRLSLTVYEWQLQDARDVGYTGR